MSPSNRPPEPWNSFFKELDEAVDTTVRLDCIGGFVVTLLYGMERPTADVDVIELAPRAAAETMIELGIRGGPLHQKYRIYLDRVAVAAIPESYEDRLVEMFPGAYRNLHLMALDPYDLALSKLERNSQKDRDDVRFLARSVPFDLDILQERYATELRWQLGVPKREDLTMQLWLDAIREDRGMAPVAWPPWHESRTVFEASTMPCPTVWCSIQTRRSFSFPPNYFQHDSKYRWILTRSPNCHAPQGGVSQS